MPTALSTTTGPATGGYVNDAYGTITQTAGTAITRCIPPRDSARTRATGFSYDCGATAHTLTFLAVISSTTVSTDAAASQSVVKLSSIPTAPDGSILAASDWLVLQYEDGSWVEHAVSSLSGTSVTVTDTLTQKIKAGSIAFFMGAPGDHTLRQITLKASTITQIVGSMDCPLAAGTANGQPIVVHSDNSTNAGKLTWLAFGYGSA